MESVKELVLDKLVNNENQIQTIEKFHLGFLNDNYLVKLTDGQKYVVRITKPNDLVNHSYEYEMMNIANQTGDFKYYDLSNGNYIRNYYQDNINGDYQKCIPFINNIIDQIKKLHKNPIQQDKHKKYNYEMYVNLSDSDGDKYFQMYKKILNYVNNQHLNLVLSHNDLNPTNILGFKNNVYFIDFEFSCLNYDYFDYGYFLKEIFIKEGDLICLSIKNNWNYKLMLSFIYITCYISYIWSVKMPQTSEIINYTNKIKPRLNYYFNLIQKFNN